MTDVDTHHLAAAFALDALDAHERESFESHYPSCDVCRDDVANFRHTITQVAEAFVTPPPSSLRARVMAEIALTRQVSPMLPDAVVDLAAQRRRRRMMVTSMLATAAAVAAVVFAVSVFRNDSSQPAYASELARVLEQPDAQVVDLESKGGDAGTFRVVWSNSLDEAVLIGEGVADVPDGKAYELWLVTPDEVMAMNVLQRPHDGHVKSVFEAPADPTAWAITVEPEAGVEVATSEIVFLAEV